MDMRYDTGLSTWKRLKHRRHQGSQYEHVVAWGMHNNDCELKTREVLLILQIPVDREKDIELRCGQP